VETQGPNAPLIIGMEVSQEKPVNVFGVDIVLLMMMGVLGDWCIFPEVMV
jgi:hypothetical protein